MTKEMNTPSSKQSLNTGASTVDALARRRLLLNGLGKGSVVLAAAAVPMHSLASTHTRCKTDGKKSEPVWATVSGCHSAVGSRIPHDTPMSEGHGCSHYREKSCWPGYSSDPKKDTSCVNKKFKDVFGGSESRTCYDLVTNYPTSSKCRWVLAHQNAVTCESKNFPYSQSEVKDLYKYAGAGGRPSRADCETFFKTHMENCA